VFTSLFSAKIVIYDLQKNVRFTVTQAWDRSPDSLAVCCFVTFATLFFLPSILSSPKTIPSSISPLEMKRKLKSSLFLYRPLHQSQLPIPNSAQNTPPQLRSLIAKHLLAFKPFRVARFCSVNRRSPLQTMSSSSATLNLLKTPSWLATRMSPIPSRLSNSLTSRWRI
jgi:hypothetical protein